MTLSKQTGNALIVIGTIHVLIGLVAGKDVLFKILEEGFVNGVDREMDKTAIFWFLFAGFLFMILGKLMQEYIKATNKPLPFSIGYYEFFLCAIGCIMMPASGFWLVLAHAVWIIAEAGRTPDAKAAY